MLVTYATVTNRVGQAFRLTYVQGVSSDPTSKLLVQQETKPLPDGVKKASSTARHLNCYSMALLAGGFASPTRRSSLIRCST